jgi:hypothetical protein
MDEIIHIEQTDVIGRVEIIVYVSFYRKLVIHSSSLQY